MFHDSCRQAFVVANNRSKNRAGYPPFPKGRVSPSYWLGEMGTSSNLNTMSKCQSMGYRVEFKKLSLQSLTLTYSFKEISLNV